MIAYFIMIFVPILVFAWARNQRLSLEEQKRITAVQYWKQGNSAAIYTFFIIYFFLLALRGDTVGVDLGQYLPRFQFIAQVPWDGLLDKVNTVEPGYVVLNKAISIISEDNQIFLTIIAGIVILPIMILYRKFSEHALISIVVFLITPLFSMFFSGLRQSIAIAIAAPAFYFVKHKKKIPFLVMVLLAYSFHASGLILIFLYPLYHAHITKKWLYGIIPFIGGVFIFNGPIFNFLLLFMGNKYQDRYGDLSDTGAYSTILLLILFAVYSFVCIDDKQIDKVTLGLRNILLLTVILQLFAPISSIAMRMNYYYLLFVPLIISRVSVRYRPGFGNIVFVSRIFMCVFFIFYFLYKGYYGVDTLQVFPYIPFWKQ